MTLIDLLEAVCRALPAGTRVRLGSLEPRTIAEELCRRAAALPDLSPSLPSVHAERMRQCAPADEPEI